MTKNEQALLELLVGVAQGSLMMMAAQVCPGAVKGSALIIAFARIMPG